MKEMNDLETQFRSWPLRHPSPRLKRRIFAAAAIARRAPAAEEASTLADHASPPFRLAWLAPATMALLLLCVLFNQRNNPFAASGGGGTMVAVALSNQSAASWLPGSFVNDHNSIPAETFEMTNGGGTSSNARMFRGTN
jgi:hypothetical protein